MAGNHQWEIAPKYNEVAKEIQSKAKPIDAAKTVKYRLDQKVDGQWQKGAPQNSGNFKPPEPGTYRVVVIEEAQPETESADVVVPAAAAGGPVGGNVATVTQEFDPTYASRAAWGLGLAFGLLGLVLFVMVMRELTDAKDSVFLSAVGMPGLIAVLLVFAGIAIGGAGAFLMAVEQRSVMRIRTEAGVTRGPGDWDKVIDALGKLKPAWAVLLAAAACFLAAAWIGGKIADSATTTSTTTTTVSTAPAGSSSSSSSSSSSTTSTTKDTSTTMPAPG